MNKKDLNYVLLSVAITLQLISIFIDFHFSFNTVIKCISFVLLSIVFIINIKRCRYSFFNYGKYYKEKCFYHTKEECPYGDEKECIYDKSFCHVFRNQSNTKNSKKGLYIPFLIVFFICSVILQLLTEDTNLLESLKSINAVSIIKVSIPLTNALIAALLVATIIDIPSKMKEYQTYFVELLSSSDYLKKMSVEELINLRKEVTWLLHVKDYPHMPQKLIDMDEKFCEMLKKPYYKEYSITINLSQSTNPNYIKKSFSIEYTAFNPKRKDSPITMDISFINSLRFENGVDENNAKGLFNLKKFSCSIDNSKADINLLPLIEIGVSNENRDGFLYNGRIALTPKDSLSNEYNPINAYTYYDNKQKTQELKYKMIEECGKAGLFISFSDILRVKMQYEIEVPESDISYTKRLRYPAKYFHLDYSVGNDVNYTVAGQLIGTMIDQPNATVEVLDNKKRIKMDTHSWLLPKNGVVVVHCKE